MTVPALAQRKKEKPNYLRRPKAEAETWFTFCGKKNESKVKVTELAKAESLKTIEKYFDGLDILGMDISIKNKAAGTEEKLSSASLSLTPEMKNKLAALAKGDKVSIVIRTRNRSTQVKSESLKHTYFVSM